MASAPAAGAAPDHSLSALARLRDLPRVVGDGAPLGTLIDGLGRGAMGLSLLLLAVATFLPGLAPIFGLALVLVSLDMLLDRPRPTLPGWLRRRRVRGQDLEAAIGRIAPRLTWLEKHVRPRAPHLLHGGWVRLAGAAVMLDAVLIVLPIPFGNTAPALSVLAIALGLAAQDGKALLAGLGLSALALIVDAVLTLIGFEALLAIYRLIF